MRQAHRLFKAGGSYVLTMYCSGLAVECILRAFRWKKDKSFEGRHDLRELLKASALIRIHEEDLRRQKLPEEEIHERTQTLLAAMTEVVVLWHNNLRFASEDRLTAYLKAIDRVQGIRGNPLKKMLRIW